MSDATSEPASESPSGSDPLGNLFSKLRGSLDEPDPEPEPDESPVAPSDSAEVGGDRAEAGDDFVVEAADDFVVVAAELVDLEPAEPEPTWPVFAVAESATLDDAALRRRRDASVGAAVATVAPRVKRQLQDEQNELLDTLRRQKAKADATTALGSEADQLSAWIAVLGPSLDDVYAAGRTLGGGRTRVAPPALTQQLVALLVLPLRERVLASVEGVLHDEPYDSLPDKQRAIANAVGARYREWRGQDLDAAIGDLLTWAYVRGIFDAAPEGMRLRWVPSEDVHCPDCDDNALEPTVKGRPFPTGQSCAPAHPGCRCLVVPIVD